MVTVRKPKFLGWKRVFKLLRVLFLFWSINRRFLELLLIWRWWLVTHSMLAVTLIGISWALKLILVLFLLRYHRLGLLEDALPTLTCLGNHACLLKQGRLIRSASRILLRLGAIASSCKTHSAVTLRARCKKYYRHVQISHDRCWCSIDFQIDMLTCLLNSLLHLAKLHLHSLLHLFHHHCYCNFL